MNKPTNFLILIKSSTLSPADSWSASENSNLLMLGLRKRIPKSSGMGGQRQEASVDVPMAEAVGAAGYFKGAAGGSEEDPSTPTREAGPKRPGVSQGWGP